LPDSYQGATIATDAKVNLNGLVSVDEKLSQLGECIKKNNLAQIS
jgi:hypothetical protein